MPGLTMTELSDDILSQTFCDASITTNSFPEGAILHIKLKDFLTYDAVEFNASPFLNLIIGPNATGKSTIVNAICLGLGGKTSTLGRAKDIVEFIKHGRHSAVIQITLRNSQGRNHVIKRIISRTGNPNAWFINNRSTSNKQVEELVNGLGIQVSNLCQFLPQDRVADFVKMTNTELLVNTLKAANRTLFDQLKKLKEAQKTFSSLEMAYTKLKEHLEREIKLNEALERDVANIKERQVLEEQLADLHQKRPWLEYEKMRLQHCTLKAEKDEAAKRLKTEELKMTPARKLLEKLIREEREMQSNVKDLAHKVAGRLRELSDIHNELEKCADSREEVERGYRTAKKNAETRKKRIEDLQAQINAIQTMLDNRVEVDHSTDILQLQQQTEALRHEKQAIEGELDPLNRERDSVVMEMKALEAEMRRVTNTDQNKLNVVRRKDKTTYEAILWVREHKHEFAGTVYEPPIMTLNMKDKKNAKYIENVVSFNDMKLFICTDPADTEKLFSTLRTQMKLPINVATALTISLEDVKREARENTRPIDQLRRYGFYSYLLDMVEGPEPVVVYLSKLSGLHRIPVGDSSVNRHMEEIPRATKLTRYLSDTTLYSSKASRFSGNVMTRASDLRAADMLIYSVDETRLHSINQELRMLKDQEKELSGNIESNASKLSELEEQRRGLDAEKNELKRKQNEKKQHEQKLERLKRSLGSMDQDSIDLQAERNKADKASIQIYNSEHKLAVRRLQLHKALLDVRMKQSLAALQQYCITRLASEKKREIVMVEQSLSDLKREVEEKKRLANEMKEAAKRLQAEAKKAIGNLDTPSQEIMQKFHKLPSTLDEVDAAIADVSSRIDLIYVDKDRSVVHEFNDRKRVIEKLKEQEASKAKNREDHQSEIDELKSTWLPPVQTLISKISSKFSQFFKFLKCAGEIQLKIPPDPNDYDAYGIAIHVKYGDNKPMKELTTFQSGGERSVATVLYMLALQDLSTSPFRCVDEINQGMDADNERKVFELLVSSASAENTSQCFLLTPKLLPDLPYGSRTTIHIIQNGPYNNMETSEWNVPLFIDRRRVLEDEYDD